MSGDVNVRRSEKVNVFHFLLGASKATFMPYFFVFAKVFGLTGIGTGIIVSLQLISHSAAGLITQHFVHRSKRMKLILVLCLTLMVLNYGVLLVIPLRNKVLNCKLNETIERVVAQSSSPSKEIATSANNTGNAPLTDFDQRLQQRITNLANQINDLALSNQTHVSKLSMARMSEHLKNLQTIFAKIKKSNVKEKQTFKPVSTRLPDITAPNVSLNIYQRIEWLIQRLHKEIVNNLGVSNSIAGNFTLGRLTNLVKHLHAHIQSISLSQSFRRHRRSTSAEPEAGFNVFTLNTVWNPNGFLMPGTDPKILVMVVMCILMVTGSIFLAPVERSSDSLWFSILDKQNDSNHFGSHHLWSSIGYGSFGGAAGVIVHFIACSSGFGISNFFFHLCIFVIMLALTMVVSFFYPYDESPSEISWMVNRQRERNFRDAWRLILSSNHTRLLFVSTVIFGITQAPLEIYVYWRAVDFGVNEVIIGCIIFLRYFFEPFYLFISIKLMKKISYNGVICSLFVLMSVRYLLYSFLTESWQFLLIEIIHSLLTTLYWSCIYAYPDLIVDPNMDRKVQNLINFVFNLGFVVGLVVSGILYDYVAVYAYVCYGLAVFTFVWCVLFGIIFRYLPEKQIFGYTSVASHEPPDGESPHEDDDSEEEVDLFMVKET